MAEAEEKEGRMETDHEAVALETVQDSAEEKEGRMETDHEAVASTEADLPEAPVGLIDLPAVVSTKVGAVVVDAIGAAAVDLIANLF